MKLTTHRYGKSRVRVMKILRDGATHTIKELTAAIALEGDFESSYTAGDNSLVVPTDTIKNTVNVLAHEHLGHENERFASVLGRHFLQRYAQVERIDVELVERVWNRMQIDGKPHPHSFAQTEAAEPFTRLVQTADAGQLESGVRDLLILKSTASGFAGYPKCELTTLPETQERIFATSLTATWRWTGEPADYAKANAAIVTAMLRPFAENYSPSVQTTLYEMGAAALAACTEIGDITIAMPNKHCLPINLQVFGRDNRHEIFMPTDEPHGQIEATISRTGKARE
jgi:urate oxidase